jgi:ParB-like chromosome segregation protein Spo0J
MNSAHLQIEMWPVSRLRPRPDNARTHSEAQIDQIAASVREFGWTNPILVGSGDDVIAGHGRLRAATERLNLEIVPVIVLAHLTESQRRALVIADNQLALNAGWDEDLLRDQLEALKADEFNLELLGFDDTELAEMLAGAGEEQTRPR